MPSPLKPSPAGRQETETARDRILDAAEALFAKHGYYAATMREIARKAGVPTSLITHHFGTKDDLFSEVIHRRVPDQIAAMHRELADAKVTSNGKPIRVEALIHAYIGPMLVRSASGDAGWKNYARLLGLAMHGRQYAQFLQPMIGYYDPITREIMDELRLIYPHADAKRMHWVMYFLQSAILHVLVEAGMVDRQSGGLCSSSDLLTILDEMVAFYAAGFEARLKQA